MAKLDPAAQTILEKAKATEAKTVELHRAAQEADARFRRAYHAWLRVYEFKGDTIQKELSGEDLFQRFAELIVDLGQVLKREGYSGRLDSLSLDSDAKIYAATILRSAMDRDVVKVATMVRESVTVLTFGIQADNWLREGLMYEVLGIRRAPEPPAGWEGGYYEAIETPAEFIAWIDSEFLIHDLLSKNRGSQRSDGRIVRNAYRLVLKLNITGVPLEPVRSYTLNDELAVLRNLWRLLAAKAATTNSPNALNKPPMASGHRAERIRNLEPAVRSAYFAFQYAAVKLEKKPRDLEYRVAYGWLSSKGIPDDDPLYAQFEGYEGELDGYKLPQRADTWSHHVGEALRVLGEQKHKPRAGRSHGKSIVKADQIEPLKRSDE